MTKKKKHAKKHWTKWPGDTPNLFKLLYKRPSSLPWFILWFVCNLKSLPNASCFTLMCNVFVSKFQFDNVYHKLCAFYELVLASIDFKFNEVFFFKLFYVMSMQCNAMQCARGYSISNNDMYDGFVIVEKQFYYFHKVLCGKNAQQSTWPSVESVHANHSPYNSVCLSLECNANQLRPIEMKNWKKKKTYQKNRLYDHMNVWKIQNENIKKNQSVSTKLVVKPVNRNTSNSWCLFWHMCVLNDSIQFNETFY